MGVEPSTLWVGPRETYPQVIHNLSTSRGKCDGGWGYHIGLQTLDYLALSRKLPPNLPPNLASRALRGGSHVSGFHGRGYLRRHLAAGFA